MATLLAGLSFLVNIVYLFASRWLSHNAGVKADGEVLDVPDIMEPELSEVSSTKTSSSRKVRITDLHRLGDPFWIYMGLNVLCGTIWSPFLHLAANVIQRRYLLSESSAAKSASILLAGPLILYPLCGIITDLSKARNVFIVHHLFILSSSLTLFCYIWLSLPVAWTGGPVPGVIAWGIGHGFATLLLVIVVPTLVPVKYVSTALGAHKSIESCGSTLATTLAGILLDKTMKEKDDQGDPTTQDEGSVHRLLLLFLAANVLQLGFIIWLWRVDVKKTAETEEECEILQDTEVEDPSSSAIADDERSFLLPPTRPHHRTSSALRPLIERYRARSSSGMGTSGDVSVVHGKELLDLIRSAKGMAATRTERRRGKRFMVMYWTLVLLVWVVFIITAIVKLKGKSHD